MENYLITTSLLNSFDYFLNYSEDEARAIYGFDANVRTDVQMRDDFILTLKRERSIPNEAMQKGIDFEDKVRAICKGASYSPCNQIDDPIREIAEIALDGLWQQTCQKKINVNGIAYLLYGKMDVIKHNWIYDIKFVTKTANYELGKFLNSVQHRIYMFCTGIGNFSYLVSDGKQVWKEEYRATDYDESIIKNRIRKFREYLKNDAELEHLFLTNWKSK